MEPRKQIGKISEEELLSLLTSLPEKAQKSKTSDSFLLFIETFNFQPGKIPVKFNILYTLYNAWASEFLSKLGFARKLGEIFEKHKDSYFINTDVMTLSKEAYKLLTKKQRNRAYGEKNQRHFENFLTKFNIKSGKDWTEFQKIHPLYLSWTKKNNKVNPIGKQNFIVFLKAYFKTRMNSKKHLEIAICSDYLTESNSEEAKTTNKK